MPQPQLSEQEAQAFGTWLRKKGIVPVPVGQEVAYGRAIAQTMGYRLEEFRAETQPVPVPPSLGQALAPPGSPIAQVGGALGRAAGAVGQALLTPIGPQGTTTPTSPLPTGPGPGVQPRGGLLPGYESNIPVPPSPSGVATGGFTQSAKILAALPDNPTEADLRAASKKIMQLYANAEMSWEEAEPTISWLDSQIKAVKGTTGGDNTASYLARLSAQEQLAEQRRQFDITSAQQVERDKQAIENEKNRVRQAIADLQMQGTNVMGTAYNQALSMHERAARAAVPAGATYVPGYEPGGLMSQLYSGYNIPFQPRTVAQGTTLFNAFQAMPQVESGIAAAIARAMGTGGQ